MWLPPANNVPIQNYAKDIAGIELELSAYNHPVVILSPNICADRTVVVLLMTSFGGQTFQQKFARAKKSVLYREAEHYLPIAPSKAHPPHRIRLTTEGGLALRKNGYVKTKKQIRVKLSVLVDYDKFNRGLWAKRLSQKSYEKLKRHVGFVQIEESGTTSCAPPPLITKTAHQSVSAFEIDEPRVNRAAATTSLWAASQAVQSLVRPATFLPGAYNTYNYGGVTFAPAARSASPAPNLAPHAGVSRAAGHGPTSSPYRSPYPGPPSLPSFYRDRNESSRGRFGSVREGSSSDGNPLVVFVVTLVVVAAYAGYSVWCGLKF